MLSFYVKFWADRRTDIKTDKRTPVKQYTPDISMRGLKMTQFHLSQTKWFHKIFSLFFHNVLHRYQNYFNFRITLFSIFANTFNTTCVGFCRLVKGLNCCRRLMNLSYPIGDVPLTVKIFRCRWLITWPAAYKSSRWFRMLHYCVTKYETIYRIQPSISTRIPFNLFPNNPLFYVSFENTVGKGEIARNEQFLLFPQCFLAFWRTCCRFPQIQNCHLQIISVWKSLDIFVWEKVKTEKRHIALYRIFLLPPSETYTSVPDLRNGKAVFYWDLLRSIDDPALGIILFLLVFYRCTGIRH